MLFALDTAPLRAEEEQAKVRDIGAIEAELKNAVAAKRYEAAKSLLDELAARGAPKAYRLIVDHALTGSESGPESVELEGHAGALLAASSDPKVHEEVYNWIKKHPNWKTRIILLGVAVRLAGGDGGDARALLAIQGALRDADKHVQFKALQSIRSVARREFVPPLIAELEKAERQPKNRFYYDIRDCLKAITGEDFQVAADWKNYWEAYKEGRKPREKKGGVTELYRPKFFSATVDSDRVFFVIDISGSMIERDPELPPEPVVARKDAAPQGKTEVVKKPDPPRAPGSEPPPAPGPERERLYRAKRELMQVIDSLPESTRFGILCFSHELAFWKEAKTLRNATPENKADAKRWVQGLRAAGATRTDLALNEALSIPEVDSIFLLTDGAPRNPGQGAENRLKIEPILQQAKALNRFQRCRIHTISFEQIKDKDMRTFVKELAAQNDGTCTLLR